MLDTRTDDATNANRAQENIIYHQTLMEGLHDLYEEAAKDGLLKQAEDLVDVLWASVPTNDKLKIKVYDLGSESKIASVDAWKEALRIQPPEDMTLSEKERMDKRQSSWWQNNYRHKERTSRKVQIWTDVVYELGFLYKRKPYMMAEPDKEDIKEWEEAEAERDGPVEGLLSSEDKEEA
jgi:hypothetical protein